MSDCKVKEITIDGVKYVRADSQQAKPLSGKRAVIVADRGWIFAGDVTRENGRIYLTRAIHVFSWESGGFSLCVSDPKKAKADLRPISDVDMPADCELFCLPVGDAWGVK
jgi:hypothetical protein